MACVPMFGQKGISRSADSWEPCTGAAFQQTRSMPWESIRSTMNSSVSFGLTGGMNFGDHFGAEFLWNHQPTQAVAHFATGIQPVVTPNVDVNNNQYPWRLPLLLLSPTTAKLRPYALIGFGATNSSGNDSSVTKFSYGLGGGLKYYFNDSIGVRVQARYSPTYLYTNAGGLW